MTLTAIDLFAGAGGATQGLRDAGFDVVAAVENDLDAASTWSLNHPGHMVQRDVRLVSGEELLDVTGLLRGELDLLKACPPCQGFSSLRGAAVPDPARNDLVIDTLRLVASLEPRAVLLENVPGLRKDFRFASLAVGLRGLGYSFAHYFVEASALGVPQRRRRLVVVAVRGTDLPATFEGLVPLAERRPAMSAGQALEALRVEGTVNDPIHVWRQSRANTLRRIMAVPVNGTRFDLPSELQLACHTRLRSKSGSVGRNATSSYGRVRAGEPAPTMTTRCTTPACGAFIHPVEHRGLSLREAATFQTFPFDYQWHGSHGSIERQIGNAVPVWMAEALGRAVVTLLEAADGAQ